MKSSRPLSHTYVLLSTESTSIAKTKEPKRWAREEDDDDDGDSREAPMYHREEERGVAGTDAVSARAGRGRNDAEGGNLVNRRDGGARRRRRQQGTLSSPPSSGGRGGRGATVIPPSPNSALSKPDSFDYLTAEVGSAE